MIYLKNFNEKVSLVHVTSVEISKRIKQNGFKPIKNDIEYKYYSNFGKDGIYFYNNIRLIQQYAYFIKSKLGLDEVVLIHCKAPSNIIKASDKIEDGLFVSSEDLHLIEINKFQTIKKPSDLY